jgi:hypothetical protein
VRAIIALMTSITDTLPLSLLTSRLQLNLQFIASQAGNLHGCIFCYRSNDLFHLTRFQHTIAENPA